MTINYSQILLSIHGNSWTICGNSCLIIISKLFILNINCRELLVNEHKYYHLKAFMAIRGPFMVIRV